MSSTATEPPTVMSGSGVVSPLAIRVDDVTKRYGHHTVVEKLSFDVRPGRVTGFLGPNGSGKTTTMKVMVDLASADGGGVTIGGRRYRDLPDPARTVGVVLEPDAFHPGRSGRNHLRILADAAGIASDRVDSTLEMVELGDAADRHVGGYSLGMRQRLGLGAAMLGDPPVLILDEPGNGLDPQGIRTLRDLLRARAAAGATVLVSSHLLSEVEHLADDVVVVNQGRLVVSGPLHELQQPASLVRTPEASRLVEALERAGAATEPTDDGAVIVRGMSTESIGVLAFGATIELHELSPHAGSLEELFLAWTSDGTGDDTAPTAAQAVAS
jgi:ABC-2 type transport system ATP-binding protein